MDWSRAHFLIEQHPDHVGQYGFQSIGDAALPVIFGDPLTTTLIGLFLGFGLEMGRRLCIRLVFSCGCCLSDKKETDYYNNMWKKC